MKNVICITLFSIQILFASHCFAQIIYSDNFEEHETSYILKFGDPEIVDPVLDNPTKSLKFNCEGNPPSFYYDQIAYLVYKSSRVDISFDITTQGLIGSTNEFSVLMDVPDTNIRPIRFMNDGKIMLTSKGSYSPYDWYTLEIQNYIDEESIHVHMRFDIENDQWDVLVNRELIFSGAISDSQLEGIRFSLGLKDSRDIVDLDTNVFIDNILIQEAPFSCASDLEGNDLDVDGKDLFAAILNIATIDLETFAGNFGRTYCIE